VLSNVKLSLRLTIRITNSPINLVVRKYILIFLRHFVLNEIAFVASDNHTFSEILFYITRADI